MKYAVEWMLSGTVEVDADNKDDALVIANHLVLMESLLADHSLAETTGEVWEA